jgi:hypothetical protein
MVCWVDDRGIRPGDKVSVMRGVLSSVAVLIGLLAIAGCEQPNHQARIAYRENNLRATVAMLQDVENHHPETLRGTVAMLQDINRYDQQATQRNAGELDRAVKGEFDLWREREPVYRERIRELMQGDPGAIDRTIPWMLY